MVITVSPDTIMTEVADLFDTSSFHHIPVVNSDGIPLGIISSHDYHQLQHHLSHVDAERSEKYNLKLFRSLLASDVMSRNPICLSTSATLSDALDIFLKNEVHSIIIVENRKCVGIITPHDILKVIHAEELVRP